MRYRCSSATPILRSGLVLVALAMLGCKGGTEGAGTTSLDPPAEPDPPGEVAAFPFTDHVAQSAITAGDIRFDELFVLGDELFETQFNALDGSGALALPDGTPLPSRFSRVPPGGGRFTGPNAQACAGCHNSPLPTSAGEAASNVIQDPDGAGLPPFNRRNTPSLFGSGVIQRLAEEMTEELIAIREAAELAAVAGGPAIEGELEAKGIAFGVIRATRAIDGTLAVDASGVDGVDEDLVIRPFGWKGDVATLRDFVRGAARNEIGMEPDELVAKDPLGRSDPDGDGVEGELSIGDITAITVYCAAQEIPATIDRLSARGLAPPPTAAVASAVARGRELFGAIGCAECHVPALVLEDSVFEEPTLRGGGHYVDTTIDASATALDPLAPFTFDLAREGDPPRLERDASGRVIARVFGDLRRHRMGRRLADGQATPAKSADGEQLEIDGVEIEVDVATFLTPELWGSGSTGPWMHDGRAGTLAEAIELHGEDVPPPLGDPDRSDAQEARDAFLALGDTDRTALVEFLESLVLFSFEEE